MIDFTNRFTGDITEIPFRSETELLSSYEKVSGMVKDLEDIKKGLQQALDMLLGLTDETHIGNYH